MGKSLAISEKFQGAAAVALKKIAQNLGADKKLAEILGMSHSNLSKIFKGTQKIQTEHIEKAAQYLRENDEMSFISTPMDIVAWGFRLIKENEKNNRDLNMLIYGIDVVSKPETMFDTVPSDSLHASLPAMKAEMKEGVVVSDQVTIEHVRRVPVFDAQAGHGADWTDMGYPVGEAADFEYVAVSLLDANSFCVRIHGDSMSPTLEDGDVVLVNPSVPLVNGKICFARTPEGEAMVKRYREHNGTIILESDNRAHGPKVYTADNGNGLRIYRATRKIGEL